jgi:hypothetical protein
MQASNLSCLAWIASLLKPVKCSVTISIFNDSSVAGQISCASSTSTCILLLGIWENLCTVM